MFFISLLISRKLDLYIKFALLTHFFQHIWKISTWNKFKGYNFRFESCTCPLIGIFFKFQYVKIQKSTLIKKFEMQNKSTIHIEILYLKMLKIDTLKFIQNSDFKFKHLNLLQFFYQLHLLFCAKNSVHIL